MERIYDPTKFSELANSLLLNGDYERESRARTAIGRFYYAAFLLAWRKLSEKGISIPESGEMHKLVITIYNDKGLSSIGNRLDQLRESRVDADYHMRANVTIEIGKKCSKLTQYTIDLLNQVKEIK